MSLLDTIKAAREEAEEAGTLPTSKKVKEEVPDETAAQESTGFSRRSAARAKPTRELAGSVRTGAKPTSEMTKEEKRAAKKSRRAEEDLMLDAKRVILESRDDYRHTQRIWWIMVGAGLVMSVGSFLLMRYLQNSGSQDANLAMASMAMMVAAYVLIIGAFIYDLVKVRPLRRQADDKILGMSKRRLREVVEADERRKAEKK